MKKIAAIIMLLSLIVVPVAFADWNDEADNGDWFHKVPAMASRGTVNAITSPGYLIEDTCNGGKDKKGIDALGGTANGIITGFGKMCAAGVGGVWDVATAAIPEYRGAGHERGMWPNYKWETSTAPAA